MRFVRAATSNSTCCSQIPRLLEVRESPPTRGVIGLREGILQRLIESVGSETRQGDRLDAFFRGSGERRARSRDRPPGGRGRDRRTVRAELRLDVRCDDSGRRRCSARMSHLLTLPVACSRRGHNDTVSVLLNSTGLCTVPNVKGKMLPRAKRVIARARCRLGKVRWAYSKIVKRGRVMSEKPKPGTVLPKGGKVNLAVSRGGRT
jgi:hypothetical protein